MTCLIIHSGAHASTKVAGTHTMQTCYYWHRDAQCRRTTVQLECTLLLQSKSTAKSTVALFARSLRQSLAFHDCLLGMLANRQQSGTWRTCSLLSNARADWHVVLHALLLNLLARCLHKR
jgi:hypothetical protein